jgi:hypothetical protein
MHISAVREPTVTNLGVLNLKLHQRNYILYCKRSQEDMREMFPF